MPDQTKSHFERFLRPILASRFLTISALIHLLLIVLFGGKVLFNKYVEPPDFQSAGDSEVSTDVGPPPPQTPDTLPPTPTLAPPPAVSAPATASLAAITSLNTTNTAFAMPVPAIAPPTLGKSLQGQGVQQLGNGPAVSLPGQMAGRGSGRREATGEQYGEKPASEQAVLRALRWLQSQQNPSDGTWGSPNYQTAYTGLALLCFLGHGETPQTSHEFGVVVTNAIGALVRIGNLNHGSLSGHAGFGGSPAAYEHGIATYALCEAYTMTKDETLVPLIKEAVDYIVKGQRTDGGWAYSYDVTPDVAGAKIKSDTSVSGWQIQALKAAHLTGIAGIDDAVHPVLDLAMKNLDRVFNPKDGSFGYRVAGDHNYTLTGVGVLSKLFWLGRADREVHEGLKNIESKDLDYSGPACNLYAWYYDTQACYQAQGGAWDWWKDRFQSQLTGKQGPDGSWLATGGQEIGGGKGDANFSQTAAGDGPVYRTVFCCLMLEVFYRYLPTSKESALSGAVQGL